MGNYTAFLIRRFFRLYPAYFVTTALYLAVLVILTERAQKGEFIGYGWFNSHYNLSAGYPLTAFKTIGNFFFFDQTINGVTWTLKVEVYAAILLPLMHLYSCAFKPKTQGLGAWGPAANGLDRAFASVNGEYPDSFVSLLLWLSSAGRRG